MKTHAGYALALLGILGSVLSHPTPACASDSRPSDHRTTTLTLPAHLPTAELDDRSPSAEVDAYLAQGHSIPRQARVDDLLSVTNAQTAARILDVSQLVYRHYVFANRPPRAPAPKKYAAIFAEVTPGLCEGASAMVRLMLQGELEAANLNLVAPYSRSASIPGIDGDVYTLLGHTIAEIRLERGSVAIDPTYGYLLITGQAHFDSATFQKRDYRLFALFETPRARIDEVRSLYDGRIYSWAASELSDAALSGQPLTVRLPRVNIPARGTLWVGKPDSDSTEIESTFGGWANHIGFWYEPSRHVWRFRPQKSGVFEISFLLLGGEQEVLRRPLELAIEASGGTILSIDRSPTKEDPTKLVVTVRAHQAFDLRFESGSVPSSRRIDAVSIRQMGPMEALIRRLYKPSN